MNGGQQVLAEREHLAQLDVGRPQQLEPAPELALQPEPTDLALDERAREKGGHLDQEQREALDPGELVAVTRDGDGAAEHEPGRVAERREVALDERRRLADVHDLVAGPLGHLGPGVERRRVLGADAAAQARHPPQVGGDGLLALGDGRPGRRLGGRRLDRARRRAGVPGGRDVLAGRARGPGVAALVRLALSLGQGRLVGHARVGVSRVDGARSDRARPDGAWTDGAVGLAGCVRLVGGVRHRARDNRQVGGASARSRRLGRRRLGRGRVWGPGGRRLAHEQPVGPHRRERAGARRACRARPRVPGRSVGRLRQRGPRAVALVGGRRLRAARARRGGAGARRAPSPRRGRARAWTGGRGWT